MVISSGMRRPGKLLGCISFRICRASMNRRLQRSSGKRRMLLPGKRRMLLLPGTRGLPGMWTPDMWLPSTRLPGMRLRMPGPSNRTRSYPNEQQSTRTGTQPGLRRSMIKPLEKKIKYK
jgi:hypothetical protein